MEYYVTVKKKEVEDFPGSPVVKTPSLHCSTAAGTGLIPGWGTKILHAGGHSQKKKSP